MKIGYIAAKEPQVLNYIFIAQNIFENQIPESQTSFVKFKEMAE